jgi:hypothetical protein
VTAVGLVAGGRLIEKRRLVGARLMAKQVLDEVALVVIVTVGAVKCPGPALVPEIARAVELGADAGRGRHAAAQACILCSVEHDVDDAGRALGVVAGRRIGVDLHALHVLGREAFQVLHERRSVHRHGIAVHVDGYVRISAQVDVAVHLVDPEGGQVLQHINAGLAGAGYLGLLHVVDCFAALCRHGRPFGRHGGLVHLGGGIGELEGIEGPDWALSSQRHRAGAGRVPHKTCFDGIPPDGQVRDHEVAGAVGGGAVHERRVGHAAHGDIGARKRLVGLGTLNGALHDARIPRRRTKGDAWSQEQVHKENPEEEAKPVQHDVSEQSFGHERRMRSPDSGDDAEASILTRDGRSGEGSELHFSVATCICLAISGYAPVPRGPERHASHQFRPRPWKEATVLLRLTVRPEHLKRFPDACPCHMR